MSAIAHALPVIFLNLFLGCIVGGTIILCALRIRSDDLSDGVPGDVPQVIVTAVVAAIILAAALNVPGASSIMEKSAGAVAAIIPLALSPWLAYKGFKAKVTRDGNGETEVTKE